MTQNIFRYHKYNESHGSYGGFTTPETFMEEIRKIGYKIKKLDCGINWNLFNTDCNDEICREVLSKLKNNNQTTTE